MLIVPSWFFVEQPHTPAVARSNKSSELYTHTKKKRDRETAFFIYLFFFFVERKKRKRYRQKRKKSVHRFLKPFGSAPHVLLARDSTSNSVTSFTAHAFVNEIQNRGWERRAPVGQDIVEAEKRVRRNAFPMYIKLRRERQIIAVSIVAICVLTYDFQVFERALGIVSSDEWIVIFILKIQNRLLVVSMCMPDET